MKVTKATKASEDSITIKHFAEWMFPGIFVSETSVSEVPTRDQFEVAKEAPNGAFAFCIFDVAEATVDGEKLSGERKNNSPLYYLGGRVMTLAEVEKEYPNEATLLYNMRNNGYDRIIRTSCGQFVPFNDGDLVI